jgi:hypothetical protein
MNKGVLLRLAMKVTLLLGAIFVFINIIKVIISQSLFFIGAKFGNAVVWTIIGLAFLSRVVIYIIKYRKRRNQDNF